MNLADLQKRLSEQYARLRELRNTENYPVYAIEHGLTPEECSAARKLLNENFRALDQAHSTYALVWTAIAAEVGYNYDGTEYWVSFRETLPAWLDRQADRNKIRSFYKAFANEYRGLTPSGPWAGQFPIIAWPITQAILPRYLQRQFADHLFDLRHALVRSGELTLQEIGDLLSARYSGSSSRFEGFLQQKALTARIVLALGLEGIEDTVPPIEKTMLDRIASDIDKLGSFGTRLREARRVLREARFVNSEKVGFVASAKHVPATSAEPTEHTQRPRLVARPLDAETWTLSLALPALATLLRKGGLSPRDLEQARMRFRPHGEGNSWAPGRALFSYNGEQEEPLAPYPDTDIDVFSFERPLAAAQSILRDRLRFSAQPLRLLKLRADGAAFELLGGHVRANQSYILVASKPIATEAATALGLAALRTSTPSAHLWRLDVHSNLDAAKLAALRALGLGYQLGIRVEPLGLSPRWATSDGCLVLLDTETPMFSVSSDVAVREYAVSIDDLPPARVTPAASGATHISLGALSIGAHRIAVSALGAATGSNIVAEDFSVAIRPASPWRQSIEGKAGVSLRLDPREAAVEQFLDGTARIRVMAPPRRTVTLANRFYGADGTLFHEEVIGRYSTPLSDDKVSDLLVERLTSEGQLEHVERAARIEVSISLDEYGAGQVAFEKEAEAVRWLRVGDGKMRLSDDTAESSPLVVERFDLDAVDVACAVDYQEALTGIDVRGKGGLFVAALNGRRYEAILTAVQRQITNFNDLGVPARVSSTRSAPAELIAALKRWHSVRRLLGPMAFVARRNAVRALERALAVALCGDDWVASVDRVISGKQKIGDLYSRVYHSRGFASGIANFVWRYDIDEATANAEFSRLLGVYKILADAAHGRAALRLAFQPQSMKSAALQSTGLFDALRNAPELVRGAYFARLATDMRARSPSSEVA